MNIVKNIKNIINKNAFIVYELYCTMLNPCKVFNKIILCLSLDNYDYISELKKHNIVITISDVYNIFNDYTFNSFEEFKNILIELMKKFDYIIMNPPYQRNLHLKILAEAITYLKDDDSICVNLSPIRWLEDPLATLKPKNDYHRFENSISKHIENLEIISTINARIIFDAEFLQPLGIYKCKTLIYTKYLNIFKNHDFILRVFKQVIKENNFKKLQLELFNNKLKNFVLINNMAPPMKYGKPMFDAVKTWCGYFTDGKNINGLTYNEAKNRNTRATRGNLNKDCAIIFKTQNETKNCYNAMQTNFIRFFVMTSVIDVHVYQQYIPWMQDYTEPWTDERFYKYFNITEEEQKIIEETMAKYK